MRTSMTMWCGRSRAWAGSRRGAGGGRSRPQPRRELAARAGRPQGLSGGTRAAVAGEPLQVEAGGLVEHDGGFLDLAGAVQGVRPVVGGLGGGAVVAVAGVLVDRLPEP